MSEEKTGKLNEDLEKEIKPSPPPPEQVDNPVINTKDTELQTDDGKEKHKEPINVNVNIQDEVGKYKRSEIVAIWSSVAISLALAIVTYLLFLKTVEANKISQLAFKESKRANDITEKSLRNASEQAIASAKRERTLDSLDSVDRNKYNEEVARSNNMQNKLLQSRIEYTQETQRQFEVTNRPYLQVNNVKFFNYKENEPLVLKFDLINLGAYSAKILSGKTGFYISDKILVYPFRQLPNRTFDPQFVNKYVFYGYPSSNHSIMGDKPIPKNVIDSINANKYFITMFGEFIYTNEVTGKIRIYNFSMRPLPNGDFIYVKNENRDSIP